MRISVITAVFNNRAIQTGRAQRIPDVSKDDDYIPSGPRAEGSELVVLLKIGERVIGTINIEHPQPYAFHNLEQSALEALAQQVGAAIALAEHIAAQERANRELRRKKQQLVLAQMAIMFHNWSHFMGNRVGHLARLLKDVQGKVETARSETAVATIRSLARMIENMQGNVADLQKALDVANMHEKKQLLSPADLLDAYMTGYGAALDEAPGLSVAVDCAADDPTVRVHAGLEGMLMIFDGIVANAIEAMSSSAKKELTLAVRQVGNEVHFRISDTGKGINPAILDHLFTGDLPPRTDKKGHQIGLALAAALLEGAYRGRMLDPETSPAGTTMIIALPIFRAK